jgi:hypothetical protein
MVTRLVMAVLILAMGFVAVLLGRGEWWLAPLMSLAFASMFFEDHAKAVIFLALRAPSRERQKTA